MSCNAYIEITVTLYDEKFLGEMREWSKSYGFIFMDGVYRKAEDASYLDSEACYVAEMLADITVPRTDWKAHIAYENFSYANEDGSIVEFDVIEGKLCNYKESRIVMVEREPWFRFDLCEPWPDYSL